MHGSGPDNRLKGTRMDRLRLSSILLVIIGIAVIAIGVIYISTPRIMSYHENFIGMTHEEISEINPKLADMMLVFLRGIGVLNIGLGTLGIAVSLKSYRKGQKWAWHAMLISYLIVLLPTLVITYYVGAFLAIFGDLVIPVGPFFLILVMLIVFLVAIVLPAKEFSRSKSNFIEVGES